MITTKKQLKEILKKEKKNYLSSSFREMIGDRVTRENKKIIWKYQKNLRKVEYYHNHKGLMKSVFYLYYRRKKNILGRKLGIDLQDNSIDEGLIIYHSAAVVINGNSKIGKNFKIHGGNCVGNSGSDPKCPIIGDNVDLGYGASIIGDIRICSDVKIGAGAVVVKSIVESGTYVGVPARKVN